MMMMINMWFNKKGLLIFPLLMSFSACSYIPIYEKTYTVDGKQIMARASDVEIHMKKQKLHWIVYYVNNNDTPKCVATTWEVFDLVKHVPNRLIYVPPKSTIPIGFFRERTWKFDNILVRVGGGGHVDKFENVTPYKNRKDCKFPKGILL